MSRPCTVFLVGEGPDDIGGLAREHPSGARGDGYLQPILRRLAGPDISVGFSGISWRRMARFSRPRGAPDIRGRQERQALRALLLARHEGADACVMLKDLDKEGSRKASAREARRRHDSMCAAMAAAAKASSDEAGGPVSLWAVACRTVEAWALGDLEAVSELVGQSASQPEKRGRRARRARPHHRLRLPARPEELWGKRSDPDGDHPKKVLERLLGRRASAADLAFISERSDPSEVEANCPMSFPPLALQIRMAIADCRKRGSAKVP